MSEQYFADASQNSTRPAVTFAEDRVFTVAVRVTAVFADTVDEERESVVTVGAGAAQARTAPPQRAITEIAETHNNRQSLLTFTDNLHSCFLSICYSRFTG
jgi:hypothetical protein